MGKQHNEINSNHSSGYVEQSIGTDKNARYNLTQSKNSITVNSIRSRCKSEFLGSPSMVVDVTECKSSLNHFAAFWDLITELIEEEKEDVENEESCSG